MASSNLIMSKKSLLVGASFFSVHSFSMVARKARYSETIRSRSKPSCRRWAAWTSAALSGMLSVAGPSPRDLADCCEPRWNEPSSSTMKPSISTTWSFSARVPTGEVPDTRVPTKRVHSRAISSTLSRMKAAGPTCWWAVAEAGPVSVSVVPASQRRISHPKFRSLLLECRRRLREAAGLDDPRRDPIGSNACKTGCALISS